MDWESVAARVKRLRAVKNITQPELAKAIGKHRATVARLEGGGPVYGGTLYAIARALDVSIEELTGEPLGGPPISKPTQAPIPGSAPATFPDLIDLVVAARELSNFILIWENTGISGLTFGDLAKVIAQAHRVMDTVKAVEAELQAQLGAGTPVEPQSSPLSPKTNTAATG